MKYTHIFAYATLGFVTLGCQPDSDQNPIETEITEEIVTEEVATKEMVNPDFPTYTIATIITYPPFATTNELGNVTGFDIDIMRAISEVEQFNAEFIVHPWDRWQEDLIEDKVDIWAAGITIKDKRREFATYSEPYMNYETAILTLNTSDLANISETTLNNYTVGAEADSTSFEIASSLQPDTRAYDATYNAFEALLRNEVHAVVGNNLVLGNLTTSYSDFKYKITPLSADVTHQKELGFMVKKGRSELSDKINSGLDTIKANGTYNEIKIKWFGNF